jgi:hypothetical protein
MKMKKLVAEFETNKYHVYDVKTTGKHPVHMIEGGEYITEDMEVYDEESDMGCFYLNTRDYNEFKKNLKEVEINQ